MRICIFGASGRELDARYYAEAEATGRLIGENGDSIVFGGGAEGLMGRVRARSERGRRRRRRHSAAIFR